MPSPLLEACSRSLQWLGKQSFLDDLASLDPDLYQGLVFLKNFTGNMEDLSLNFTAATDGGSFVVQTHLFRDRVSLKHSI